MMHDLPLVIFTVLSQLVVGGFITIWWLDRYSGNISRKSGLIISISIVVIGIVSVLVSLFHLGQPFAAYRAILNIGVSWLSREVTFYGLFVGLSILYYWFWYRDESAKRHKIGWVTSFVGIVAIFSSAKIYMIPAVPAWNSVTTVLIFFITSFILGPLFVGLLLSYRKELTINISGISIVSLIAGVMVMIIYFTKLQAGLPEAVLSSKLIVSNMIFWIRMGTFLTAFVLLSFAHKNHRMRNTTIYSAAFTILLISEFLARLQFYEAAVHL